MEAHDHPEYWRANSASTANGKVCTARSSYNEKQVFFEGRPNQYIASTRYQVVTANRTQRSCQGMQSLIVKIKQRLVNYKCE